MALEPTPEQSYCADQARRNDWDRFICTLFAPRDVRESLFCLIAFNCELARTRDVISQPLLGQIRLQWWRDALAAIHGDAPPSTATATHPILVPLAQAIADHNLDRSALDAMIDARSDELDDDIFTDIDRIGAYVDATAGNLARLQLKILSKAAAIPPNVNAAVGHVAFAAGIVELIDMGRIAPEYAIEATPHLAAARSASPEIDRRYLPALLPATLVDSHLRNPNAGRARRQIRLALNAFRGKF
jgi:phytoene synthase